MMEINILNLCDDLDQLLKDICDFLSDEINNKNRTEEQHLFANKLIQRSKKQLQEISKVSSTLSTETDNRQSTYVDMTNPAVAAPEEDVDYIELEPSACPYELLPASDLETCDKYGNLIRKGRFLFIEHQRKVLVGIKGNWLLIYGSKKDNRPTDFINLAICVAKPIEGVSTKVFELTCTALQKNILFVAQTPKDMAQWVAHINSKSTIQEDTNFKSFPPRTVDTDGSNLITRKPLPPIPHSKTSIVEELDADDTYEDPAQMMKPDISKPPSPTKSFSSEEEGPYTFVVGPPSKVPSIAPTQDKEQPKTLENGEHADTIYTNQLPKNANTNGSKKRKPLPPLPPASENTLVQETKQTYPKPTKKLDTTKPPTPRNAFTNEEEGTYSVVVEQTPTNIVPSRAPSSLTASAPNKEQPNSQEKRESLEQGDYAVLVLKPNPNPQIDQPSHDEGDEYCRLEPPKTILNNRTNVKEDSEEEPDGKYEYVSTASHMLGKQFIPSAASIEIQQNKMKKDLSPPPRAPKPKLLCRR